MTQQDYTAQQDSVNIQVNDSSEEYEFEVEESPRTFFTQTPNIVLSLGLHPSAFLLYFYYRSIGSCFKKKNTITEETGLSRSTILRANTELREPRKELGGKALISIVEQRRKDGSDGPNKIVISDIWRENDRFFSGKATENKEKFTEVQNEPGGVSKRSSLNNTPSKQEGNVQNVSCVSSKKEEKRDEPPEIGKGSPIKKDCVIPQALKDMEDLGMSKEDQQKIANQFSEYCIVSQALDTFKYMAKEGLQEIKNIAAFFTSGCQDYQTCESEGKWRDVWEYRKTKKNTKRA